ncbi:FUSC family protein [Pseudonocardia aurantiaca]|uniref:FUSC family protein n=1 Tax=Pseudonocardia aurantiaca TaxID=75290 RepID=A0ABW4FX78_9PSEU
MREADDGNLIHYYSQGRTARAWVCDAVDRLAGADPGLNQLRMALQAVLGVVAALGLTYLFVRLTGAMQLPVGSEPAAVLTAANYAMLLVSMLVAGIVAMMSAFTVQDPTARGQVLSSLLLPVLMLIGLVLGLLVGPYHVLSLAYLVLAMAVAVYIRRFPPRGFGAGMGVFFGAFLGFFLSAELALHDIGWIAADLGIGALASLLVRFAFFRPDPERTLARMFRSAGARSRRLLTLSVGVLAEADERRIRAGEEHIRRQLVRLNETTLMIDAQLAETRPRTAAVEAHRLFDAELALSDCARFAVALATEGSPSAVRRRAADAVSALLDGDPAGVSRAVAALREVECDGHRATVQASRLAACVEHYAAARDRVGRPLGKKEIAEAAGGDFTPAVLLVNNWLPGSVPVSAEASTTRGRGRLDRATMASHVRTTVQITIAGTLAVVAGNAVSGPRLYWAVLATFFAFVMATNSGEQLRRALFRIGGTAIGIVVGDLFVHLTGGDVWSSLAIILVALFLGIYLIRLNYMFMVIAITVVISQLYEQLAEFSWQLLVLRLAETAIGAGAVILTVLFIVPLHPQRVLTTGVLRWFTALRSLLESAFGRLDGQREPLRPLVRDVDAAYAALVASATPLRPVTFGRNSTQLTEILVVSSAARQHARSLAAVIEKADADGEVLPLADNRQLRAAAEQLQTATEAIERRIATGEHGRYVRSSALVALALDDLRLRQSPLAQALDDLTLLDGALARLATALQMDVDDHDTGQPADEVHVGNEL